MTGIESASKPWSVGDRVDGRYELRRDLGRGAAGIVFEARHAFTGRRVALKLVASDAAPNQVAELRARLTREARALATVRHPGIVDVLDGGVLPDGTPYVVMEMLDGRTLEGLLAARGKLSIEDTVALALQLCDALGAAHETGLVHRDVKPGNVLVVYDIDGLERVKLLDFGIARVRDEKQTKLTGFGVVIGTAAYMAPEQLLGLEDVDLRADVYALGVTMFECLAGDVPYLGSYERVVLQACSEGPPPPLPAPVGAEIAKVVHRAMAKKREERFATTSDLAKAIRLVYPNARRRTSLLAALPAPTKPAALAAPAGPAEQRRFPRAPYVTPVSVTLPTGTVDGRTEDISEGGLLVVCNERCAANVAATVRFALPIEGLVVTCKAHLRWVRSARPGATEGPRALGLEFIDAPADVRASVARYVALMTAGPRSDIG
jgi:eukaryotic-like serine/threonine-protein kinase